MPEVSVNYAMVVLNAGCQRTVASFGRDRAGGSDDIGHAEIILLNRFLFFLLFETSLAARRQLSGLVVGALLFAPIQAAATSFQAVGSFQNSAGDFDVAWARQGDSLFFRMSSTTDDGWIGIGFSDDQMMPDTDVVMGFDLGGGVSRVDDRWAFARAVPRLDAISNITVLSSSREGGTTTIEFMRPISTGDTVDDMDLARPLFLLWARGPLFGTDSNASFGFHAPSAAGPSRGFSAERFDFASAVPEPTVLVFLASFVALARKSQVS